MVLCMLQSSRTFGICRYSVKLLSSTEGRRQDPQEFWSPSRVESLTREDEEALASQQETQMIFFIQQVARDKTKTKHYNPSFLQRRSFGLVTQSLTLLGIVTREPRACQSIQ